MSSEKTTSNNQSNHFPTPFAQTYFHGTKAELQLGDLTKLIMCRGIMFLIVLMIITGCTKSRNQEIAEEYKDQFLTLAEFNCEGIQSDHYIYAEIDNNSFCENSNDSVQSQIHLTHNYTSTSPSTDTSAIVPGSSYYTVIFGVHQNFELNKKHKWLIFETEPYADTLTLNEIASEIFVEGKLWPINGNNIQQRGLNCFYEYSDGRKGFNTYYQVNTKWGKQVNKNISMDKVSIKKDENFIIYNIEMTFNADLYIDSTRYGSTNLWGEVRNGEMKAQFKIPK